MNCTALDFFKPIPNVCRHLLVLDINEVVGISRRYLGLFHSALFNYHTFLRCTETQAIIGSRYRGDCIFELLTYLCAIPT